MAFEGLELALEVIRRLAPIEAKIRRKRKSLAEEVETSSESVVLNMSEARKRIGLDRADLNRRAEGSAGELTWALKIAEARGYITHEDFVWVDEPLDRVRAILYRLTH